MSRFTRSGIYAAGSLALLICSNASALEYFELETYPYKTANRGEFEVENFTSYTSRGTKGSEDVAGSNAGLTRSTFELTYGITDKTELALYRDYARERGGHFEHVGSRYHVRTRFYEKGELPVDLGMYVELATPRGEETDLEGELRGIVETDFGRWTLDVNPIFERVLRGTGEQRDAGWTFKYALSLIYRPSEFWQPRLDLFGDFGPLQHFSAHDAQQHLLSPAVDFRIGHSMFATLGVGIGLTDATEQRLVRARLEWEF